MYKTALLKEDLVIVSNQPDEFVDWEELDFSEPVKKGRDIEFEAMCSGDGALYDLTEDLKAFYESEGLLQYPNMSNLEMIYIDSMILVPIENEESDEEECPEEDENIF